MGNGSVGADGVRRYYGRRRERMGTVAPAPEEMGPPVPRDIPEDARGFVAMGPDPLSDAERVNAWHETLGQYWDGQPPITDPAHRAARREALRTNETLLMRTASERRKAARGELYRRTPSGRRFAFTRAAGPRRAVQEFLDGHTGAREGLAGGPTSVGRERIRYETGRVLDAALRRAPVYRGRVYRGMPEHQNTWANQLQPGYVFRNELPSSSSADPRVAARFAARKWPQPEFDRWDQSGRARYHFGEDMMDRYTNRPGVVLAIRQRSGRNVAAIAGDNAHQREVILLPGTSYRVVSRTTKKYQTTGLFNPAERPRTYSLTTIVLEEV